jgi:hypothetical protein
MRRLFLYILIVTLCASCKKIADFYIGIPFQPRFDNNSFHPGLNIFGIIRTDSTDVYNNSFVLVQKVVQAVGSQDSIEVDTVDVVVYYKNSNDSMLHKFLLTNFDSSFIKSQYRPSDTFRPKAGETCTIECHYQDLPVLHAKTIIPEKPEMVESSVISSPNSLYFEIKSDTTIYMLDIYLFRVDSLIDYQRLPTIQNENTAVNFGSLSVPVDSIVVFGYDYNMAKYYLTSNISLNFNKYRETFGTVTGGYGVFGSVNKNYFLVNK